MTGSRDRTEGPRAALWCPHGLARTVLPPEVAVVEAPPEDRTGSLYSVELREVQNAVPVRRHEFSTGRDCARAAMRALGVEPAPIPRDPDRAPVWPAGLAGSITHTRGHCAVGIARSTGSLSLGVDIEEEGRLLEAAARILTDDELQRFGQSGVPDPVVATLVFSAKECFYKAQHPHTGRYLGFRDVSIRVDWAAERFWATPLVDLSPLCGHGFAFAGQFRRCCGLVATGMVLRAEEAQPGEVPTSASAT